MDNIHLKSGTAIPLDEESGLSVALVERPAHFTVELSVGKTFLRTIRTNLSGTPFFTMRHASM
jgi:hypothetical protein